MIPFFRKIRKKMADDNKPIKYLRYAIGEIMLIVIGILIALSINAWNTRRIDKGLEKFYIQGIVDDIELNVDFLNRMISLDSTKVNSGNYLLNHFKNPTFKKDSLLLKHFANSIPISGFRQTDNVFEDMKSSGRLYIISNDIIRKKIQDFYYDEVWTDVALVTNNNFTKDIYDSHILSGEFDINSVLTKFRGAFFGLNSEDLVEVNSYDPQIFYKPINDILVKEFIDRLSMNILCAQLNVSKLKEYKEKANILLSELKYYLK